jgi:hypothetical protein
VELESTVELVTLRLRDRKGIRGGLNGVPNFFDELHALSHRELTNVVEGKACHAESLRDSTERSKHLRQGV